ncbi:MAG: tetratricopeptide repeat protein [Acidobacteriia bacterium]|nr:tetratricopeptide repeat protein [Terriglobia bacterium]
MRRFACILLLVCLAFAMPAFAHHIKTGATKTMPLTTSSPKARDLYERAMTDYENLYLERANLGWRAAAEADPNLALAFAWIAFNSRNPAEASAAREKAKALAAKASPGEQLMVQWITNVQETKFIAGIAAMNDMLEMYPKDKRLAYLVGNWLMLVGDYERAGKLFERALALDKNYPAALNDLAYAYARDRHYNQAFDAMQRYIVVLPNQPNPQDSYAEILRMSGNYEGALEHYRAALKIDPGFVSSQLGLADTYALMGNQAQARAEYDKAIQSASTDADRLDYGLQKAATWAREGNLAEADKAFLAVAERAHASGIDLEEAQAHRSMSLYQTDDAVALKHLEAAEDALSHQANIAQSDKDQELARILQYRAVRASHSGNQELADKTLHQLETMAGSSRDMIVQSCYHGAAGALLVAKEKFADAIPHLEEDRDNPYSMALLSRAYSETGANDKMHEIEARLRSTNAATMEQAMVVPAARAKRPE